MLWHRLNIENELLIRGRFQGNDINDMRLLPNKMKTELALHVHLETLRRVSIATNPNKISYL